MIHKHAVEIIAWAGGEEIQYYDAIMCRWADDKNPKWIEDTKYRVKPEPKQDVVVLYNASVARGVYSPEPWGDANLRLRFDGETGKLKTVEVMT